jgi:hypothetical protein
VETATTLDFSANWQPLTNFTVSDSGNERTITHTNATGSLRFYRVKITNP